MQEVRAAVIGTGVMGRKYAQMIAEGKAGALRLTAVVCRSAGAQQWAKDTLPDTVRVCPSADQLYDYAEEFDAVLVVTPHKTHPALVMMGRWARSSGCSWKTAVISAHGCTTAPAAGVPAGQGRAAARCSIRDSTFWTSGSGCSGCRKVFMP